jgi:hypothetical protein
MRVFLILFLAAIAFNYWYPGEARSASTEVLHPRSEKAFKLESECGVLRGKADIQYRREHASVDLITVTSHYSQVSNRCLVRIRGGSGGYDDDDLYDAQTMEVLAHASRVNIGLGFYTASIGHAGGTDYAAWNKAKNFIERAMQEDK